MEKFNLVVIHGIHVLKKPIKINISYLYGGPHLRIIQNPITILAMCASLDSVLIYIVAFHFKFGTSKYNKINYSRQNRIK